MTTDVLNTLAEASKALAPVLTGGGGIVALLAWWTSRSGTLHQNSKAQIETLQAAIQSALDDGKYQKFLEDVRKEKLASLAFGVPIRPGDLGRLMEYYDQGFASTQEIGLAWEYRSDDGKPLSFALGRWQLASLIFGLAYMLFCVLGAVLSIFLAVYLPSADAWRFGLYAGIYAAFAVLSFWFFRGQMVANALSRRERRRLPKPSPALEKGKADEPTPQANS